MQRRSRVKMSMNFRNLVKGRVAESLLITLLERAGYRVTRMGVEELFDEIKYLDLEHYHKLMLPVQLRSIPDLLVADTDITKAYLVEVKFRRRFDKKTAWSLHTTLVDQRRQWPESYAVLMVGEPAFEDASFHQDYIRVIPPGEEGKLTFDTSIWSGFNEAEQYNFLWNSLPEIQKVFKRFFQSKENQEVGYTNQQNADLIAGTLRNLAKV